MLLRCHLRTDRATEGRKPPAVFKSHNIIFSLPVARVDMPRCRLFPRGSHDIAARYEADAPPPQACGVAQSIICVQQVKTTGVAEHYGRGNAR